MDGNNHKITGLNSVLFNSLQNAKISNLVIESPSITKDAQKGVLANSSTNSTISNVQIMNATIRGNVIDGYEKGGLIGKINGGTIDTITIQNINIDASHQLGGIAAKADNATISNVVVTGTMNGRYYNPDPGNGVGGIVGNAYNTTIENVFTKVTLKANYDYFLGAKGTGGIIGGYYDSSVTIKNAISASDIGNLTYPAGYRIAGFNILGSSSNVYELSSSHALTNITDTNGDRIKLVDQETLKTKEFYMDTLGWSDQVWDFADIMSTGIPK